MGKIIPYFFFGLGLFFLLRGLAALLLAVVMIVMTPLFLYAYYSAKNKEYKRVMGILSATERTINQSYERMYFAKDAPPDLDERGIPYL